MNPRLSTMASEEPSVARGNVHNLFMNPRLSAMASEEPSVARGNVELQNLHMNPRLSAIASEEPIVVAGVVVDLENVSDAQVWEALGDEFMQGDGGTVELSSLRGEGKVIGLYFSAHWCPPCQAFTPQLIKAYQKLQAAGKQLEIIFISSDRDMGQFSQYFATMPWLAIPPGDERRATLSTRYEVQGLPTFVLVDGATGATINASGRAAVGADPSGEKFPWPVQVVEAMPLRRQMSGRAMAMASAPTPETKQKNIIELLLNAGFQGILPISILVYWYRDDWGHQYCETTDLSTWALVFGWVNMSIVTWQFLVQVWFWQINWKYFTTGGEEAQKKSLKRLKLLKQLPQPAAMFQIVWFCWGQSMIWNTTACDGLVYDNITHGGFGCLIDNDGYVTCDVDPRPDCCFGPMHNFARIYSIICFVLMGVFVPCICCFVCMVMGMKKQDA